MARTFLVVHGVVQGVGYRDFVRSKALARGLRGFVRNRSDGSVEVLCEGSADVLKKIIEDIDIDTEFGAQVFKIKRDDRRLAEFEKETYSGFLISRTV